MANAFERVFGVNDTMSHREKYTAIVNGLGYETVKRYVPFTKEEIVQALKTDEYLNNLPLRIWDEAAGKDRWSGLGALLRLKGVRQFSLSEEVCILKQCARMMAEKEGE